MNGVNINNKLKKVILPALLLFSSSVYASDIDTFNLTVKVDGLRNSSGAVQFALYNEDGTIPDEEYQNYYKKQTGEIVNNASSIVFEDLPKGRYAVNVLHDENMDGKIDKGFIFPVEGIGFTNYESIGLANRPNFVDASFEITANLEKMIKVIYF
jgi:uncharacterized protein (DUF2141 family)